MKTLIDQFKDFMEEISVHCNELGKSKEDLLHTHTLELPVFTAKELTNLEYNMYTLIPKIIDHMLHKVLVKNNLGLKIECNKPKKLIEGSILKYRMFIRKNQILN